MDNADRGDAGHEAVVQEAVYFGDSFIYCFSHNVEFRMHLGHGAGHSLFAGVGQDFFLFLRLFSLEEVVRGNFNLDEAALDGDLAAADRNDGAFTVDGVNVDVAAFFNLDFKQFFSSVLTSR